jgi:nicotinamide-nucleotide amidase
LLSYFFTKHNGASVVLDGALVTYSNGLKENWLAVDEKILQEFGAVSAEVVAEMSEGALSVSGAEYALAVSGIAGDGGGTKDKPVGTVFVGVRTAQMHQEEHCFFEGDRNYVQQQSAFYALKMLVLSDLETFF